jgi:hypothetical protein
MSLYTTFPSWEELIDFLHSEAEPPQCFTVNYQPNDENYAIWIGNQPYYSYEKLIELEQQEKDELRNELARTKKSNDRLMAIKVNAGRVDLVDELRELRKFKEATENIVGDPILQLIENEAEKI